MAGGNGCFKSFIGSSLVVQWVQGPALSLPQLGPRQWRGFDPWARNFRLLKVLLKIKRERERVLSVILSLCLLQAVSWLFTIGECS